MSFVFRRFPLASAVALLVLAACAGPERASRPAGSPPEHRAPRHLFLVTVDTLRADHTSLHGYVRNTTPRLREIAAGGALFEHAIAQWPKTGASFASLLSGRYPQSTGLTHKAALSVPPAIAILPEVLRQHGFTTLAVVSNPVLSRELGWDRGFDEYVEVWGDDLSQDPAEARDAFWAGRVNEAAFALLRLRAAESDRLFVWIHYSDPHTPYLLPEGRANPFLGDSSYTNAEARMAPVQGERGKQIGDEHEVRFYVAQYDANVAVVDEHAAALLDLLGPELDLLDDAAVVFTADHGESLGEHGLFFEHGPLPYNTTSHVPLFLLGPGVPAGTRVPDAVELVDLVPTLLDWVLPGEQLAMRGVLEGDSLWPLLDGASARAVVEPPLAFADAGRGRRHFRSVQDRRFKAIYRSPRARESESPRNWELYDLEVDPLETHDLARSDHPELARLRRALLAWMRDPAPSPERSPQSDQERRALTALGYVEELGEP